MLMQGSSLEIDLSTSVAGLRLNTPVYNASGVWCTTASDLRAVLNNPSAGAVVTKSCTLASREGNPKPRYCSFNGVTGSINSMGLPNMGLMYYIQSARDLRPPKPYFVSLAGLTREENLQMLSTLQHDVGEETPISGIELNLSCPNIPGKPQIGYDFEAMDERLRECFECVDRLPVGVKLPPYFDPVHFDSAAAVLRRYPRIRWVTCINSIGNGLMVDPIHETTLIAPKGGLGGIGGASIKPTALANVYSFRQRLPDSVDVIGCGGVVRGVDVFEHILCGAAAVQVGTLIRDRGLDELHTILDELRYVMRVKGYTCLDDFRGKLKVITAELLAGRSVDEK